jgi:hypothetical protein
MCPCACQKPTQHFGVAPGTRDGPTELTRLPAKVEQQEPAPVREPMQKSAHLPPGAERLQSGHFPLDRPDKAVGSARVQAEQ